jgi:cell division protein FtsL
MSTSAAPVTAAPAADAASVSVDPGLLKVQKTVDQLKARIQKQSDEIVRLKQQLAEARVSQSRIRRIPKKQATEA